MDVSHAILFLENADFVRITGLYFPAKFELPVKDPAQETTGILFLKPFDFLFQLTDFCVFFSDDGIPFR